MASVAENSAVGTATSYWPLPPAWSFASISSFEAKVVWVIVVPVSFLNCGHVVRAEVVGPVVEEHPRLELVRRRAASAPRLPLRSGWRRRSTAAGVGGAADGAGELAADGGAQAARKALRAASAAPAMKPRRLICASVIPLVLVQIHRPS